MSFLSSLFCCSATARDDADDKYTNSRSAGVKALETKRDVADQKLAQNSPAMKYDTNDSSNLDKNGVTTHEIQIPNVKDKKELDEEDNSVNETDTITNNDETKLEHNRPIEESEVHSPGDTDKQVASNIQNEQNVVEGEAVEDGDSLLDLTRIQEGQSFNKRSGWLLDFKSKKFGNRKCLVLDLDETLVHSSFKYLRTADFVIPVEIDNQIHHVYVIKRPGVDNFLKKVGELFEVVVFTASVSKYGDPLLDKLDMHNSIHHRLFRDSCYNYQGNFIKNLSQLGRPLSDSIIIDNSPASYIFHPQHSIPISSWFSDTHDNELIDLLPFLEDISKSNVDDVSLVLDISI